jgi:hypothetical protein
MSTHADGALALTMLSVESCDLTEPALNTGGSGGATMSSSSWKSLRMIFASSRSALLPARCG